MVWVVHTERSRFFFFAVAAFHVWKQNYLDENPFAIDSLLDQLSFNMNKL